MKLDNYFYRKWTVRLVTAVGVVLFVWAASAVTKFDFMKAVVSLPKVVEWATSNFYPDERAWRRLPQILSRLLDTVTLSVAAAAVGAVFGIAFAVLGSTTTRVNAFFGTCARFVATLFRNIDVSVWSLVLLFSFGQSSLTGFIALSFASFGFLTRSFMEAIDEVSSSSVEALRASGAGYLSIVCRSVLPSSTPQLISWLLYMIETNVRSATLVGILTGTGIGFSFDLYYKSLNYGAASLVVLVIIATIFIIEMASNAIRKIIV